MILLSRAITPSRQASVSLHLWTRSLTKSFNTKFKEGSTRVNETFSISLVPQNALRSTTAVSLPLTCTKALALFEKPIMIFEQRAAECVFWVS